MSGSAPRHVLYLDGWQARRGPGHWQALQAEALVTEGVRVDYPILPAPERPRLAEWATTIIRLVNAETVVVAHGLAALAWLRLAESHPLPRAARALLVAPPAPRSRDGNNAGGVGDSGSGDIAVRLPVDRAAVAALTRNGCLVVAAADDPWSTPVAREAYAGLGLDMIVLRGGGHLNETSQLGVWPPALEWVRTGRWPHSRSATPTAGASAAVTALRPDLPALSAPAVPPGPALSHASSVPAVVEARSLAEAVSALDQLHRPTGRRLGIALAEPVPESVAIAAADALTRAGVWPARRLARLRPRAGETLTRLEDTAYFVRRFGHEYTVVVITAPSTGTRRKSIEQACASEGCALVVLPS